MTRLMRDSTNPDDIPVEGTDLVAIYANGKYKADFIAVQRRFVNRPILQIDVNGSIPDGADVLDVENGDALPSDAPIWVMKRWATFHNPIWMSYPPIVYCNRGSETVVFNAMAKYGLTVGRDWNLWIATLDGTKTVADMTGVVAVQYRGEALTGGHYDESIVYDDFLRQPARPGVVVQLPGGQVTHVVSWDGGRSFHGG